MGADDAQKARDARPKTFHAWFQWHCSQQSKHVHALHTDEDRDWVRTTSFSSASLTAATEHERASAGWPTLLDALRSRCEVLLRWLKPPL